MALYVIVHHRQAPDQPWVNAWQDDDCLHTITTRTDLGKKCAQAQSLGERVFVYRCSFASHPSTICCSLGVKRVAPVDRATCLVEFCDPVRMDAEPPFTASLDFHSPGIT